jgi:hypothetical protein
MGSKCEPAHLQGAGSFLQKKPGERHALPHWSLTGSSRQPFIPEGVARVSLVSNTRQVKIEQLCVRNGADKRLRGFYDDVLGKSKKRFLLQLEGEHGKYKET